MVTPSGDSRNTAPGTKTRDVGDHAFGCGIVANLPGFVEAPALGAAPNYCARMSMSGRNRRSSATSAEAGHVQRNRARVWRGKAKLQSEVRAPTFDASIDDGTSMVCSRRDSGHATARTQIGYVNRSRNA